MPDHSLGYQEPSPKSLASLRDLYPDYTEDELKEAYENLRRYVELGMRIVTRIEREDPERFEQMLKQAREMDEAKKNLGETH